MVGDGFDVELGGTGTIVVMVIEVAGCDEVGIGEVAAAEEVAAAVVLMVVERWLEVVLVLLGRVDVIELLVLWLGWIGGRGGNGHHGIS
jgi:hypothetical protein